ncbi:MAG: ATP-binding protein [Sinimarinibacterium sp.]
MSSLGWRSLLGLLAWLGFVATLVGLHRIQPPDAWLAGGGRWTLVGLDPAVLVSPSTVLPNQWREFAPELRGARYETAAQLASAPDEAWVIYLPSLSLNAAVYVNGERIGDGGSMQEPLARYSFRPLLFRVPGRLLRSGANDIAVELRAEPSGSGFLQQVYLGPLAQLQPYFDLRQFLNVQSIYVLIVAVLVLGLVMFAVWWGRREERVYLWYSLTMPAVVLHCLGLVSTGLSLPSVWWEWLHHVSRAWMIAAVTVFGLHFLGLSRPRLAAFLGGYSALGALAMAAVAIASPANFSTLAVTVCSALTFAFGFYPVSLFVRHAWQQRTASSVWMLTAAASLLAAGGRDVLMENGLLAPFDGEYFHYMIWLGIGVFTSILIARFLGALRESETLNRELDDRVRQKQAELERTYEELRRSEQQRLLADERERIQRDMHDGLGGTLVSTLAGLDLQGERDSAAAQSLRSALDDLRLMIYSLDQGSGTLRAALATLRERIARLAEDAGLALEWDMQALPESLALERGATLQLMRVVQEAFTNTVKHAGAQTFSVGASSHENGVRVELRDDGAGFDPAGVESGGYGLSNMRVRAQKMGGRLDFESVSPGTRIVLWVPTGS